MINSLFNFKGARISGSAITITAIVILLLGYLVIALAFHEPTLFARSAQQQVSLVSEEPIPELPVRLLIPKIGVDAYVQYVGLAEDDSGEMAIPSNLVDVGWYQNGVRPGMDGNAVMAGHLNGKGGLEAVFSYLHTLEVGDEVIIMSEEDLENTFRVVRIETYDYDAPTAEVFVSTDGRARLNLITCGGEWLSQQDSYDKRTVVFTELVTNAK